MKAHVIGGLWHIIIPGFSFLSIRKVLINKVGCLTLEVDKKWREAPICFEIPDALIPSLSQTRKTTLWL